MQQLFEGNRGNFRCPDAPNVTTRFCQDNWSEIEERDGISWDSILFSWLWGHQSAGWRHAWDCQDSASSLTTFVFPTCDACPPDVLHKISTKISLLSTASPGLLLALAELGTGGYDRLACRQAP